MWYTDSNSLLKISEVEKKSLLQILLEALPNALSTRSLLLKPQLEARYDQKTEISRKVKKFEKNLKKISSEKYLSKILKNSLTFKDFFNQIDHDLSFDLNVSFKSISKDISTTSIWYEFLLKNNVIKDLNEYLSESSLKYEFIKNSQEFNEFFKKNLFSKAEIEVLLKDSSLDILFSQAFFENKFFVQYAINNVLFSREIVDNFNTLIEEYRGKYVRREINTVFDELRDSIESLQNEELYKKIDLNENLYLLSYFNLSNDDRLSIAQQIVDNDQAQKRLKEIVESNLEYMFDDSNELLKYLKKSQKKYILSI